LLENATKLFIKNFETAKVVPTDFLQTTHVVACKSTGNAIFRSVFKVLLQHIDIKYIR